MSTKEVEPALVVQGEVVDLASIAAEVRSAWLEHTEVEDQMHEIRFRIGRLLIQARAMLPSHRAFGSWLDEQGFGFTTEWSRTLRKAAEHEADVRAALQTQVANGTTNFKAAVTAAVLPKPPVLAPPAGKKSVKKSPEKKPEPPTEPEPTTFIPEGSVTTERVDTYSITITPDADLGKQILAASKKAKMSAYDWVILAVREKLSAMEEEREAKKTTGPGTPSKSVAPALKVSAKDAPKVEKALASHSATDCPHPKKEEKHLGWGVKCGLCNERLR